MSHEYEGFRDLPEESFLNSPEDMLLEDGDLGRVSTALLLQSFARLANADTQFRSQQIAGFKVAYEVLEYDGTEIAYGFRVRRDETETRPVKTYEVQVSTTVPIDTLPPEVLEQCEDVEPECESLYRTDSSTYTISTHDKALVISERTMFGTEDEVIYFISSDEELDDDDMRWFLEKSGDAIIGENGLLLEEVPDLADTKQLNEASMASEADQETELQQLLAYEGMAMRLKCDFEDVALRRAMNVSLILREKLPDLRKIRLELPAARKSAW